MAVIAPSLASADPLRLASAIASLGAHPYLHLDIEDGNFIDNITFGMKTVREVAKTAPQSLDAHLMTTQPGAWIDALLACGVRTIAFHLEAARYPLALIRAIRDAGGKAGVALNLQPAVAGLRPYAHALDYVLLMACEPDGRGQEFNPAVLDRIREARAILPPDARIVVDGSINESNMREVACAGADVLVMGRAVWGAADPAAEIARLTALLNGQGGR